MDKKKKKVIVIGGGAGGMMAAISAAKKGAQVLLIEKNKNLGKKILISGKGRCNVTTAKDIEEIIGNFPGNGKFLYGPLYTFSNLDLMNFLKEAGVDLKVERGDRVFPTSNNSGDIIKAFEKGDFSINTLAEYQQRLSDTFVVKDLQKYQHASGYFEEHPELFFVYPGLASTALKEFFTVDNIPKKEKQRIIMNKVFEQRSKWNIVKDLYKIWRVLG